MKALISTRNRELVVQLRDLSRFAPTELPILIEGETGTGKSLLATRIHRVSRSSSPFVVVDCGVLPPTLVASELFGHTAGAFTDAARGRLGYLERAGSGTLVLDRVDTLAAESQVALLRVLEERQFVPVGASKAHPFRARVIALADSNLMTRMTSGALRADLYHRLAGAHFTLPPLRLRHEDILPFAHSTLKRLARRAPAKTLDDEAGKLLFACPWPGNFRELAAVLERAYLRSEGEQIGVADLDFLSPWPEVAALAAERELPLVEIERLYGLLVLARHGGNVSRAAHTLGISRRTLIRWRVHQ